MALAELRAPIELTELSVTQFGELTGLSVSYVRELCEAGTIEAEQDARGRYAIPVRELERLGLFACQLPDV